MTIRDTTPPAVTKAINSHEVQVLQPLVDVVGPDSMTAQEKECRVVIKGS